MFPARNRIIAGLSRLVIVVQASHGSGATLTTAAATAYGREIGAVPGSVLHALSETPNALIANGAWLNRDARDVLDVVFGVGRRHAANDAGVTLKLAQRAVIEALREGADSLAELARLGLGGEQGLAMLAELELAGLIRRGPGGRYVLAD